MNADRLAATCGKSPVCNGLCVDTKHSVPMLLNNSQDPFID